MRQFQLLLLIIGLTYFIDQGSYLLRTSRTGHSSINHELILLADTGESEIEENESSVYLLSFIETSVSPKLKVSAEHQKFSLSLCDIEVPIPPPRG
ncbi:MAG TPA: hypothetical protein PLU37_07200 [Chitinophagaceae bacterium]|nr:hypothetical protein [Chitinophagaceae bacterium]HPG11299.1 hypothetical protein [Chitinophagaceae bacterium]